MLIFLKDAAAKEVGHFKCACLPVGRDADFKILN
jgi:hypothetical protein